MIKDEGDVRKAFKEALGKREYILVEQSAGSSFGVPDLLVPIGVEMVTVMSGRAEWRRELMPAELKAGDMRPSRVENGSETGERLSYSLRPSQHRFFRTMWDLRVRCALAVGHIGSEMIYMVPNGPELLGGEILMKGCGRWFFGADMNSPKSVRAMVAATAANMGSGRKAAK